MPLISKPYFSLRALALILAISPTLLVSCLNNEYSTNEGKPLNGSKEVRLGDSPYYLMLPDYLEISEARGKEGQLGYNISPKDTSLTMFGFIEIEEGDPIGEIAIEPEGKNELVHSTFLNKRVTWQIYQTETGYYVAGAPNWDVNAHASSKNRNDIDSLIAIISTLVKK